MESKINVLDGETDLSGKTKFCKHCGQKIAYDAVVCIHCGRQVEELKTSSNQNPNIIINNANTNAPINNNNVVVGGGTGIPKKKLTAILLCLFLGWLGVHKFYEGKPIRGIIYFFTLGLFGVGILIDFLALLAKPSTYYVR